MKSALQSGAALAGKRRPVAVAAGEQVAKINREPVSSSLTVKTSDFSRLHFSNSELLAARRTPPCRPAVRGGQPRADSRDHSRRFIRVTFFDFCLSTNHFSPSTNRAFLPAAPLANQPEKGGTVNRPLTRVSRRKQRSGHMQGRNVPVHTRCAHFNRFAIALRLRWIAISLAKASERHARSAPRSARGYPLPGIRGADAIIKTQAIFKGVDNAVKGNWA